MNTKIKSLLVVVGVVILAFIAYAVYISQKTVETTNTDVSSAAEISSFIVSRPNLVVTGANLSKVEIWAVPTGTGITPTDYSLIGQASRIDAEGSWIFAIPSQEILATEIFAKGYDILGNAAVTKSLPYTGASSIHDALWGTSTTATSSADMPIPGAKSSLVLAVGNEKGFGALRVRLVDVIGDSRCPLDVVCIQAGNVTTRVELNAGLQSETVDLQSTESKTFAGYSIKITAVTPAPNSKRVISKQDYRVTFLIEKL